MISSAPLNPKFASEPAAKLGELRVRGTSRAGGTNAPMTKLYWDDFKVGELGEFGGMRVTAEEIKEFAAQFDPQPMHLDETAARATLVGGLCASGWHTCAMMMRIVADGFLLNSSSMGAPGVDEIRWLAPLRPGDEIKVRATVRDKRASRSRPDLGFLDMFFEVLTGPGTCVMTARTNLMLGRRPPAPDAATA
jgi:acyl dehydratase